MTFDLTERASLIVDHLRTAPRKRQSHLECLHFFWHAFPCRTRIQTPVRVTSEAIEAVIACLDDSRDQVRLAATKALQYPDPFFELAGPSVAKMLGDTFLDVRINAARALIRYGDHRKAALPYFESFLDCGSKLLARLAARNLVEIAPNACYWDILFDAAQNDPKEFHQWLEGLTICILGSVGTVDRLQDLKALVVDKSSIFDPSGGIPVTEMWVRELNHWPSDADFNWLIKARDRVFAEITRLQSGNSYVNMIDDAVRRCENGRTGE